ncbi:MAG TPA: DUF5615 family PIN-like protein [Thermomicrobiales bacterium]|nr:DUF5615 family PIN-like protein [Thermomicrobiales bacterium]
MTLRFQLDEHISHAVAQQLALRGVDVVTAEMSGLLNIPDSVILEHALLNRGVVVTFDADYASLQWRGVSHAGIAYFPKAPLMSALWSRHYDCLTLSSITTTSRTGSSTDNLVSHGSQSCDICDNGSRHSSPMIATVRYATCITTGKGQAKMTATMVGADWGMAALGVMATPRKARMSAVRAGNPTKSYGPHTAVSNISTDLRRLDTIGPGGPDRSGKSTTIGMPAGLVRPSIRAVVLIGCGDEDPTRVGACSLRLAEFPHPTGRDYLKSLEHLRLGVTDTFVALPVSIFQARVQCANSADSVRITKATRHAFGAVTATAPPVRHIVAARVPADANRY